MGNRWVGYSLRQELELCEVKVDQRRFEKDIKSIAMTCFSLKQTAARQPSNVMRFLTELKSLYPQVAEHKSILCYAISYAGHHFNQYRRRHRPTSASGLRSPHFSMKLRPRSGLSGRVITDKKEIESSPNEVNRRPLTPFVNPSFIQPIQSVPTTALTNTANIQLRGSESVPELDSDEIGHAYVASSSHEPTVTITTQDLPPSSLATLITQNIAGLRREIESSDDLGKTIGEGGVSGNIPSDFDDIYVDNTGLADNYGSSSPSSVTERNGSRQDKSNGTHTKGTADSIGQDTMETVGASYHQESQYDDIKAFLSGCNPGLEHHLRSFITLGITNQRWLRIIAAWPEGELELLLSNVPHMTFVERMIVKKCLREVSNNCFNVRGTQ